MGQKGQYPNRFKALLRNAGLTMREVHRETAIPESTLYYWAAGNGVIPKDDRIILSRLIGCFPHDLSPKYDMLELRYENASSEWEREMLIKRRELLQLLGVASGVLLTSDRDWSSIGISMSRSSHVDDALLNDLEAINSHYWKLFMIASPKSSVLEGVLGQLRMHLQLLKEVHTIRNRQHLCALVSSMSQLAGEIFFDMHDYTTAQSCYVFASSSAKEADAFDLWASALIRCSYIPLFEEQFESAIPLLEQAEALTRRGDPACSTQYWVAATHAEAEAGRGKLEACQRAFERTSGVGASTTSSPSWLRFDESRLPALQGACYVRLKRADLAEPILQQALEQSAKKSRRRAMILSDLTFCALQQVDVEKACVYAEEAITLTTLSGSGFLFSNILKIQQQLAPFASVGAVRILEQHMSALAQERKINGF